MIFGWVNFAINQTFEYLEDNPSETITCIEFDFEGEDTPVKSDSSFVHLYSGYKYTIMYDLVDSTKVLYPASLIKKIKYKQVKR